jgi:hypothetical protein
MTAKKNCHCEERSDEAIRRFGFRPPASVDEQQGGLFEVVFDVLDE